MLPRLYDPNTSAGAYSNNGLGFIHDCISCEATEEKNGEYFLDATISGSDRLAEQITDSMIIKAKANDYDPPQLFEITKAVPSYNDRGRQIKISAQHIKYLCFQNYLPSSVDYADDVGTPQHIISTVFSRLALPNRFTFSSNISARKTIKFAEAPSKALGEIFGGAENSLLSEFGGEFHYDNFNIELLASRGREIGHKIVFGKNMSSYEQTLTNDASYSHIVGFAKVPRLNSQSNGYVTITSDPVTTDCTRVFPKVKLIDFTNELKTFFGNNFYISAGTLYPGIEDKLNEVTQEKLKDYSGIANQDINIKIDYRPELDRLDGVRLCDTVTVALSKTKAVRAQVTKVKYDCLAERYNLLEVGDYRPALAMFLNRRRR